MQILTRLNKVIAYSERGYIPIGNSAVCIATNKCHQDALIVTVDCVPTDIDHYEYYYINGKFVKGGAGSTTTVRTVNGKTLNFFVGTRDEYDALSDKENLFAILTDDTSKEDFDALVKLVDNISNGYTPVEKANFATALNPIVQSIEVDFTQTNPTINLGLDFDKTYMLQVVLDESYKDSTFGNVQGTISAHCFVLSIPDRNSLTTRYSIAGQTGSGILLGGAESTTSADSKTEYRFSCFATENGITLSFYSRTIDGGEWAKYKPVANSLVPAKIKCYRLM